MNMRSNNQENISIALNDAKLNYLIQGNLVIFSFGTVINSFNENQNYLFSKVNFDGLWKRNFPRN